MKYLGATEGNARHYMGVYAIDVSLTPLQNFTRDMSLIRKAVDQFAKHASSQFGSYAESRNSNQAAVEAAAIALAAAEAANSGGPGSTGAGLGAAAVQQAMAQSNNQMAADLRHARARPGRATPAPTP